MLSMWRLRRSTCTDTLFPYTTFCRCLGRCAVARESKGFVDSGLGAEDVLELPALRALRLAQERLWRRSFFRRRRGHASIYASRRGAATRPRAIFMETLCVSPESPAKLYGAGA